MGMDNPEVIKAWLVFVSSLIWPLATIIIVLIFRSNIASLTERLRSGEVAGAKFSFNETATAFIQSRIDDLAQQSDPTLRAALAGEIKDVAAKNGSLHPISLAALINAAESGGQLWTGPVYLPKKKYFDALEQSGLAKIDGKTMSNGLLVAELHITEQGKELLRSIGMESVVNEARRVTQADAPHDSAPLR